MIQILQIARRFGKVVYNEVLILTHEEFIEKNIYQSVNLKIADVIQQWNSQPESAITGLKWNYTLIKS